MVMITLGPARSRLLERVAGPVAEPLSLDETKLYLRVDSTLEDTLIADLITSARVLAEQWLRKSLMSQTWKLAYDYGIPDCVWLPMGPVADVASVVLFAVDGSSVTLAANQYWLNAAKDRLQMCGELLAHRVEIMYHTGYGDADDVPQPVKLGMLAHVAQLYDNRGEGVGGVLPAQAAGLYLPFREVRL